MVYLLQPALSSLIPLSLLLSHLVAGGKAEKNSQGGDEEKGIAGMHKKTQKRRVNLPVGFHTRSEKEKETKTSHDTEKVIGEKKAIK